MQLIRSRNEVGGGRTRPHGPTAQRFLSCALPRVEFCSTSSRWPRSPRRAPPRRHRPANHENGGFWARWFRRSDHSKSEQPHWLTPLATTTPRLEQELRYDVNWSQARPGGPYTETYGNTKGLELIPVEHVEIIAAVPAYVVHDNPGGKEWLGRLPAPREVPPALRERRARQLHPHRLPQLDLSLGHERQRPAQGDHHAHARLRKGVGRLRHPGNDSAPRSRQVSRRRSAGLTRGITRSSCTRFRSIWPEIEINQSWFSGGRNDGKEQTFVTPGVVVGRTRITDRVGFTFGAGVQIAVSRFHTSNHNIILSMRAPF